MNQQILLVDDDRAFASVAAAALRREAMTVVVAHSLHEARAAIGRQSPDLVLLDRRLPDGDGLEFLPELRERAPQAPVILVTAHGDIASAVDAIRAGASDYLTKPVELVDLVLKAKRSVESQLLRERLEQAEAELSGRHRLIPPKSPAMRALLDVLARVAKTPRSPVLLQGETGSGKEVLARHLHTLAVGDGAPFVHLNCAAIPETMFESELFGHERGAFTDARSARRGHIETAAGGTLFLDEVGELPLALQAKLLTFLDHGRFRRLGGASEQTSTARVVAATNRDLEALSKKGQFREDLYFRLSVFRLDVPPLRARREDLLPLAEGLLVSLGSELGRRGARLGEGARARLLAYAFPGNVRELRNVLERALVLEPTDELELRLLPGSPADPGPAGPGFRVLDGPLTLEELERRYVRHVLAEVGKRGEAATALGISYPTFLKKLGE